MNARSAAEGWPAHCDATLAFEEARLLELLAIWRAAGRGSLPRREDFTARMLSKHLQHLTFVEVADGRFRFRLFGTALARVTGDWTGKFLDEAVPADLAPGMREAYGTAVEARAALRYVSRFRAAALNHIVAETLVAPLAVDGGAVGGLLISCAFKAFVA
jgi:hypothetical protein